MEAVDGGDSQDALFRSGAQQCVMWPGRLLMPNYPPATRATRPTRPVPCGWLLSHCTEDKLTGQDMCAAMGDKTDQRLCNCE